MLTTGVPMVFAAEENTANTQTESQFTAENGKANIINNLTASEESEEENNDYSIDYLFMKGSKVK